MPQEEEGGPAQKEEAVPALSEEERLVLAQAEALKVRGGSGRASFSSLPSVLKTAHPNAARDSPLLPPRGPR